jgi:hypothetical protein
MKLSLKIVLLTSAIAFGVGMNHAITRPDLSSVKTPEIAPVEAAYQEWKKAQESETVESKYDRMPQECKDAGATPAECKEAGELLERVNEGPTWSGAEFDYNRSLVK